MCVHVRSCVDTCTQVPRHTSGGCGTTRGILSLLLLCAPQGSYSGHWVLVANAVSWWAILPGLFVFEIGSCVSYIGLKLKITFNSLSFSHHFWSPGNIGLCYSALFHVMVWTEPRTWLGKRSTNWTKALGPVFVSWNRVSLLAQADLEVSVQLRLASTDTPKFLVSWDHIKTCHPYACCPFLFLLLKTFHSLSPMLPVGHSWFFHLLN